MNPKYGDAPNFIPFDFYLMSLIYNSEGNHFIHQFQFSHFFCPLMTRGWAYLPLCNEDKKGMLKDLTECIVPSSWTTFSPKGISILKPLFNTTQRKNKQ